MIYAQQSYISQMEKDGVYLDEVNEQFLQVSRDLEIFSFYETEDTDLGGGFKPVRFCSRLYLLTYMTVIDYSIAADCDEERSRTQLSQ